MSRTATLVAFVALIAACTVPAYAGGPVMPRQAVKGTLIVVSDLDRADYEDVIDKLRPKYALWVDPATPKSEIKMPAANLAMVLFLLRAGTQSVEFDESWSGDLPISLGDVKYPKITIAAKTVHPDGKPKPPWYATMLIAAPTEQLVDVALTEALGLGDFPLGKPIVYDVLDLREVRAVACLPSVTRQYVGPIASAAEAALYRGLIDLRSLRVVGREALPIASAPAVLTRKQVQELASDLRVDALAFVQIDEAETDCEEELKYRKTRKMSISAEAQRRFDALKREAEAEGKPFTRKKPISDLVWAAPYRERTYHTTVSGSVKLIDAHTGLELLNYEIEDEATSQEEEETRSYDYRWYNRQDLEDWSSSDRDAFSCPLRTADAVEIVREQVGSFPKYLAARAMLPVPGEEFSPEYPPVDGVDVTAKILSVGLPNIYIDYGRDRSAREGDTFSLWIDRDLKDPGTGEVIETIKARATRIKVVEVYQKTSRCEISEMLDDHFLKVGMELVLDQD